MSADTSGRHTLKTSARSERWREAGVTAPGGASSVPPLLHGCWAEAELNSGCEGRDSEGLLTSVLSFLHDAHRLKMSLRS